MTLALNRCKCCGGEYPPVQRDGYSYYHVCPPLRDEKTGEERQRPGHRDENLVLDTSGTIVGIVAEGAGVEPVRELAPSP